MESGQSIALSSNIQQICWKRVQILKTQNNETDSSRTTYWQKTENLLTFVTSDLYGKVESKVDKQIESHDRSQIRENLEKRILGLFKINEILWFE